IDGNDLACGPPRTVSARAAEDFRQRLGERADLGVGRDEHDIEIVRQQRQRVLQAAIGRIGDVVAELPAPYCDCLRHDAAELIARRARPQWRGPRAWFDNWSSLPPAPRAC